MFLYKKFTCNCSEDMGVENIILKKTTHCNTWASAL